MVKLKIFYKYEMMIRLVDSNKRFKELQSLIQVNPVCEIHRQVKISDLKFNQLKYNRY